MIESTTAPRRLTRSLASLLGLPLLLCAALATSGCDNPACVFGGNCTSGGTSAIGTEPASLPTDGQTIVEGVPTFVRMAPSGAGAHPQTVVVIEFSESLSPASVMNAFELVDVLMGFPLPTIQPPPLVAGGRAVILAPTGLDSLEGGRDYLVRYRDGASVTDLTGQAVNRPADGRIGSFTVSSSPPVAPQVLVSLPSNGESNVGELNEIVVVFDREMDPASFDTGSWELMIGGVDPTFDTQPVPVAIEAGGIPITITQAWRTIPVDDDGQIASLGTNADVSLVLSPPLADQLLDEDGQALGTTSIAFSTSGLPVPLVLRKHPLSDPSDAIGAPNLAAGMPVIEVELAQPAQADDRLILYVFGTDRNDPSILRAVQRTRTLATDEMLVPLESELLDLVMPGTSPLEGRFLEGDVTFAACLQRGSTKTAVRLLDSDDTQFGAQPLVFDVTPPTLMGLGVSGDLMSPFASDARDLVVIARADETVRRALVVTDMGDNGMSPAVAASDDGGFFVASPVALGALEPAEQSLAFGLTIFDRALNSGGAPLMSTFEQRGAVGVGGALGPTFTVQVFDSTTLATLPGAQVFVHADDGASALFVTSGVTGMQGTVNVMSAPTGTTVVTVELEGYDLLTYFGVASGRISIPLTQASSALATTEGSVTSIFPTNFSAATGRLGDSRLPLIGDPYFDAEPCDFDTFSITYNCPFGPQGVRADRVGAQSFLAANFSVGQLTFTASDFLRAFRLCVPLFPLEPGASEEGTIAVPSLLAALPAAEQPVAILPHVLTTLTAPGLGTLVGDPRITIEATLPGVPGTVAVGLGVAFDTGPGAWAVQGAFPGAVDADGSLVTAGTVDEELRLRAELLDDLGNRVGSRPRIATSVGALVPPDVPALSAPAAASMTAAGFDLVFENSLVDAFGQFGLYRVRLADGAGRIWDLWREDPPDAAGDVRLPVPDLSPVGGTGLSPGSLTARVSAFAWPSGTPGTFLWSDVEREYDFFGHAAPVTFTLLP